MVAIALQVASVDGCSRDAVEQRHLTEANKLKERVDVLVQERSDLLSKRSKLAKRSVQLAEMGSLKRDVAETFGKSQEDLERLDLAYTARLRTISDEAAILRSEIDIERARHENDLTRCDFKGE